MKEYKCISCEKSFSRKSSYDNHKNRKTPCIKLDKSNLESIIEELNKLKSKMDTIDELKGDNKKIQNMEKEMKKLKEENELLRKDVDKLNTQLATVSKPSINNTQNIETVNILLLNAYGKEDLTHLSSKDIRSILNHGFKSIPKYIESIHFNENAPQNKNICISNRRDNTVNVYDGNKWTLKDKVEFLDDIREKGIDFIEKNIDDLDEENPEDKKILNKINRFIKKYRENDDDDDNNYFKKVNKDIQLILYNNRDKVAKTK
jgi:hypothetical protein